jgi:hypothetical protein
MREGVLKLAFIDTETTDVDFETGAVLEVSILTEDTSLLCHIKPTAEEMALAHPKALEVNRWEERKHLWENAQPMEFWGGQILDTLEGHVLVGHNVSFDEGILNASLKRHGFNRKVPYRKIDTQVLVLEYLFPMGLTSMSLDNVRKFLGWSSEFSHTASQDVLDTQRLFNLLWRATPARLEEIREMVKA